MGLARLASATRAAPGGHREHTEVNFFCIEKVFTKLVLLELTSRETFPSATQAKVTGLQGSFKISSGHCTTGLQGHCPGADPQLVLCQLLAEGLISRKLSSGPPEP